MDLLYHPIEGDTSISPFSRIEDCVDGNSVDIVCPYLNTKVLEEITGLAESWRLITDTDEWLRIQSDTKRIREFISRNHAAIHDCRNLHAKVILTDDNAVVGSANVTYSGLSRNTEMSVLIEDEPEVAELQSWFEQLWGHTEPVDKGAVDEIIESEDTSSTTNQRNRRMPDTGPTIRATIDFLSPDISTDQSTDERLVQQVQNAPSQEWVHRYFDLAKELIEFTGLEANDPRIATTIPKSYPRLPVNVNQRYVLVAFLRSEKVGMMLPADSEAVDSYTEYISDFGAFSTSSDEDPYWFEFPGDPYTFITPELRQDWKTAVLNERDRKKSSPYRNHHKPSSYKAAIDIDYREQVLSEAFST